MLNGYKTKIGIGLGVLTGAANFFGIEVDQKYVDLTGQLGNLIIGFGIYDRIRRGTDG